MKKYGSEEKQSLKNNVTGVFKNNPVAKIFIFMIGFSFLVYFVYNLISDRGSFTSIFYYGGEDLFMDFFNSVRDAAQGAEVYTVRHVIYPPMANLIYVICACFIPARYNNTVWENRQNWVRFPEAILFIFLFTLILCLIYFFLVYAKTNGSKKVKFLFASFALINAPVLYMIERGNIIFFCLIALMVYAFTYNSENKVYREIGLLALAFAFSLKLYPVIFGYFLLIDKRFKEAIRCAIYGIAMLILPSFFFGGPACFIQLYKNITSFSTGGSSIYSALASVGISISPTLISALAYLWCFICGLCFAISPFVHKNRWQSYVLGVMLIMLVPSLTSLYLWAFFIIPIMMLSNSEKLSRKEWIFFIVMTLMFMFNIFRFNAVLTMNSFLVYPLTAIFSITIVIETLICGKRKLDEIKARKLDIQE